VLRIATRKSPLALWQAEFVKSRLEHFYPELKIELVKMTTQGDKILDTPLSKIGGKNLFIKELEIGMIEGRADIAVHSMKDVPYELPEGFVIGAILERENPFDAFVSNHFNSITDLPIGSRVGSCSLRRIVQLKALRPDLVILDLRGNVNTRLQKLDDGEYDAIILACSGLIRLGFENRIKQHLNAQQSLPAVGQGALGIEVKENDSQIIKLLEPLIHKKTMDEVSAERAMNVSLQGGCSVAIGAYATSNGSILNLRGMVGNVDSGKVIRVDEHGDLSQPKDLGERVANKLLSLGARKLLSGV
jgi:hydroxymethylbilane synthase